MSESEQLLELAARDREISKLTHQRATLPERAALADAELALGAVQTRHDEIDRRLAEVAKDERRIDTEAQDVQRKADGVEKKLYSGEVTSPKELQALQADLESLRAHQHKIEDGELEVMERREEVAVELADAARERDEIRTRADALSAAVHEAEGVIDAALAVERDARDTIAAELAPATLKVYEKAKSLAGADGAAALIGVTCQGCHLTIPTAEAEAIRKNPGALALCEQCNRILVP